ncbi:MAG: GerMN domain-containing protein [Acidimicrobiales bacterium]
MIAALATAAVAVPAACGVPVEDTARRIPAERIPDGLRPTDTTIVATPDERETIDVWLVRDDRLVASRHEVDRPATAQSALDELLSGPDESEQGRSLRSAIPDAAVVVSAEVVGGIARVELAPSFADVPAGDQVLAVGQIVLTLTDLRGVGLVSFAVEDGPIAVPLPSGGSSGERVSRDDYVELAVADSSSLTAT